MTNKFPIYLDYAATTPVDERVAQKMSQCLTREGIFGNPASPHRYGQDALEVVEEARQQVADLLHVVPRNIIFTSGATEANNLALKGIAHFYKNKGRHIITAQTEHSATLDSCAYLEQEGFAVTYLKPTKEGTIPLEALKAAIKIDTILVSLMQVNNETGIIQDIDLMGSLLRDKGIFFHVDAAQSVGKLPIDLAKLSVDLLSISGHKIYGPKGIGVLYIGDRPRVRLAPLLHGGGQERKLRAGTLATHQIVGMGEACRILKAYLPVEIAKMKTLRDQFWAGIHNLPYVAANAKLELSTPSILNIQFKGIEKERLLQALGELAISAASACHSTSIEPSHVLRAMGYSDEEAHRSIRFSFGRFTTEEEVEYAINIISQIR